MPACIGDSSGPEGSDDEQDESALKARSGSLCEPYVLENSYSAGDKIMYEESNGETNPYIAVRYVHPWTPPVGSDNGWFWAPLDPGECGGTTDPDPDFQAFLDELTPEGRQIAAAIRRTNDDVDPQVAADAFVAGFDAKLDSGQLGPNLPNTPDLVSGLKGGLNVGPDGSANYSVSLPVLPGRRGLTPSLSLKYSSNSKYGELGVGWSVSKPGVIGTCDPWETLPSKVTDLFEANNTSLPEAKERICYGGLPLVPISRGRIDLGASSVREAYGESFVTVPDSGVRVTRRDEPSDPREDPGFIVRTKTGIERRFDQTRELSAAEPEAWWNLTKAVDDFGHEMTYEWLPQSRLLDKIVYLEGKREIRFEYEDHPEPRVVRGMGGPEQILHELQTIRVWSENNSGTLEEVWSYHLAYEDGQLTGRRRLASVQGCEPRGQCMPATRFEYADAPAGTPHLVREDGFGSEKVLDVHGYNPVTYEDGGWEDGYLVRARQEYSNFTVLDWNGDGMDDVVYRSDDAIHYVLARYNADESESKRFQWQTEWRVEGEDLGGDIEWDEDLRFHVIAGPKAGSGRSLVVQRGDGELYRLSYAGPGDMDISQLISSNTRVRSAHFLDVNGDGLQDLVACGKDGDLGSQLFTALATTSSVDFAEPKIIHSTPTASCLGLSNDSRVSVIRGALPIKPSDRPGWNWLDGNGFSFSMSNPNAHVLMIEAGIDDPDDPKDPDDPPLDGDESYRVSFTNGAWSVIDRSSVGEGFGKEWFRDNLGHFTFDALEPDGEKIHRSVSGDFNGDGVVDRLLYDPSTDETLYLPMLKPGTGYATSNILASGHVNFNVVPVTNPNHNWYRTPGAVAFDYNEDGRDEILRPAVNQTCTGCENPSGRWMWQFLELGPDGGMGGTSLLPWESLGGLDFPNSSRLKLTANGEAWYTSYSGAGRFDERHFECRLFDPLPDPIPLLDGVQHFTWNEWCNAVTEPDGEDPAYITFCRRCLPDPSLLYSVWENDFRHDAGVESVHVGDFDGDGRRDLLEVALEELPDGRIKRKLRVSTRPDLADGLHGRPKPDALIRVKGARGLQTAITYLPYSDPAAQDQELPEDLDTDGAGDGADDCAVTSQGDLGQPPVCLATRVMDGRSVVTRVTSEISPDINEPPLVTDYKYGPLYREIYGKRDLGFSRVTTSSSRSGELVGFVAREYDTLEKVFLPVGGLAHDEMLTERFPFAGRIKRLVTARPRRQLANGLTRMVVTERLVNHLAVPVSLDRGLAQPYTFFEPYRVLTEEKFSRVVQDDLSPGGGDIGRQAWMRVRAGGASVGKWRTSRICSDIPPGRDVVLGRVYSAAQTDTGIDDFGNVTCFEEFDAEGNHTRYVHEYSVHGDALNAWRLALPIKKTVTRSGNTNTPDGALATSFTTSREWRYCPSECGGAGGSGTCGYATGLAACVAEHDDTGAETSLAAYSHGAHGEILQTTISASDTPRVHVNTATWDETGYYVLETSNSLGQWSRQGYDKKFGRAVYSLPHNGQPSFTGRDRWGRVVYTRTGKEDDPRSVESFIDIFAEHDANGDVSGHVVQSVTPGRSWNQKRFDRENRARWLTGLTLGGQRTVYNRYDIHGQVSGTSLPQEGAPGASLPPDDEWSELDFNSAGELLESMDVEGLVTTYHRFLTDHGEKVIVEAGDEFDTTYVDLAGRVRARVDGEGSQRCYAYDADGNLAASWMLADAADHNESMLCDSSYATMPGTHKFTWDEFGQPVASDDPERGPRSFSFDDFGKMTRERFFDNAGVMVERDFDYDELGRLEKVTSPEHTTDYEWDTQISGYLAKVSDDVTTNRFIRDEWGQMVHTEQRFHDEIDGQVYAYTYEYDPQDKGFLSALRFPQVGLSGLRPRAVYDRDSWGNAFAVHNTAGDMQYYRLIETDRFGSPTREDFGNGQAITHRTYYPLTGKLESIETYNYDWQFGNYRNVQHDQILYDIHGRVSDRYDHYHQQHEHFGYDGAGRLETIDTHTLTSGDAQVSMTYDRAGNLLSKSDVGVYDYGVDDQDLLNRPYMLRDADGMEFDYDHRGNQIKRGQDTIEYDLNNRPTRIATPNEVLEMVYDSGGTRALRTSTAEGSTRRYAGGLFEREEVVDDEWPWNAHSKHHYRIPFEGRIVAEVTIDVDEDFGSESTAFNFLHRDHMGSPVVATHWGTNWTDHRSYDAWGKKRVAWSWNSNASVPSDPTAVTVGFTGHPDLLDGGLIDMGARLYDPAIARFTSPDPMVPRPLLAQGWSSYSYVNNSPLNWIDPTGMEGIEIGVGASECAEGRDNVSASDDCDGAPPDDTYINFLEGENITIDRTEGDGTVDGSGDGVGATDVDPVDGTPPSNPPPPPTDSDDEGRGLAWKKWQEETEARSDGESQATSGSERGPYPSKEGAMKSVVLDLVQIGIGGAGLVPGWGNVADGLNAAISLARGDKVGAAMDTASAVPASGHVTGVSVIIRRAGKIIDVVTNSKKGARGAAEAGEAVATKGRGGAQKRLKELGNDPKVSSADRGWIKQEQNQIARGKRSSIRNPPGKQLAHSRGREAAKGFDHVQSPSKLQDTDLHRLQHKFDDFGRKNRRRD